MKKFISVAVLCSALFSPSVLAKSTDGKINYGPGNVSSIPAQAIKCGEVAQKSVDPVSPASSSSVSDRIKARVAGVARSN